jgi:hypothetical protein
MNVPVQGSAEIEKFIAVLLKTVSDFRSRTPKSSSRRPDRAVGEYSVEVVVLITGKVHKQTGFGRLVAEKAKIKLTQALARQRAFSKD